MGGGEGGAGFLCYMSVRITLVLRKGNWQVLLCLFYFLHCFVVYMRLVYSRCCVYVVPLLSHVGYGTVVGPRSTCLLWSCAPLRLCVCMPFLLSLLLCAEGGVCVCVWCITYPEMLFLF